MTLKQYLSCFDSGQWFQLPKDFLRLLDFGEAVLLAHLINIFCLKTEAEDEDLDGDWFCNTAKQLEQSLGTPPRTQRDILKRLKSKGFLEMESRGAPPKRWFLINRERIRSQIEHHKAAHPAGSKRRIPPNRNGGFGLFDSADSADSSFIEEDNNKNSPKHPRWRKFAERFAESIGKARRINCNSNITKWAGSFRLLHEKDQVPIPRIREVLNWYCKEWEDGDLNTSNPEFIPIAYSGATFREKFHRIEAKMKAGAPKTPPVEIKIVYETP